MTTTSNPSTKTYPQLSRGLLDRDDVHAWHTSEEPTIVEMLSTIPGYVETRHALIALHKRNAGHLSRTPALRTGADALTEQLTRIVEANEPIPDDLASLLPTLAAVPVWEGRPTRLNIAIVSNGQEILAHQAEGLALKQALNNTRNHLESLLNTATPQLLAALTARLEALAENAREQLGTGGRVVDAEDAIRQDRVEEYRASHELGREYAELRRLQAQLNGDLLDSRNRAGYYLANVLEVNPDPLASDQRWPRDWTEPDAVWWFAAHPTARPWAPTRAQLEALARDIDQATTEAMRSRRQAKNTKTGSRIR